MARPRPSAPTGQGAADLDGLGVLWIEDFEPAEELDSLEWRLAAGRCRTLTLSRGDGSGRGGNATIREVRNCYGERLCLKWLLPLSRMEASGPELRREEAGRLRSFEEEYLCQRAVSGLPGFPRLMCRGTVRGCPVILMEWVEGVTLAELLQGTSGGARKPMGGLDCASIGAALALSLMSARERDPAFVHRDITPRNVIVRTDGTPLPAQLQGHAYDTCLIDFGSSLCSQASDEGQAVPSNGARVRVWRNATPEYAPPEMLTHSEAGIVPDRLLSSVDVYELCSVLYELYCGHTTHGLAGNSQIGSAWRYKSYFAPGQITPREPADSELVRLLLAGLVTSPRARIPLAKLADGLLDFCGRADPLLARKIKARHPCLRL